MRRDDARPKCCVASRVRHTPGTLLTLIAGVVVLVCLWVIWAALSTISAWQEIDRDTVI